MTDLGIPVESQRLASTLTSSLVNWAEKSPDYSVLFDTLNRDIMAVGKAFFQECSDAKPGLYDLWWAKEHNRFIHKFKQRELLLLHEIMYHFLTDYCQGRLFLNEEPKKKRRKKKA